MSEAGGPVAENTGRAGSSRWEVLARAASQRRQQAQEHDTLRQLLAFSVDGAPYAVPVEYVREIVRIRPITPVPRVPAAVCGVISLRGEIVQVIDLGLRLGLAPADYTRSGRIIVVNGSEGRVAGLLVDAVTEVLRVTDDAIRPASAGETGAVEALCVRGQQFISLLDLDQVLEIDVDG